jgi:hypothetical protein
MKNHHIVSAPFGLVKFVSCKHNGTASCCKIFDDGANHVAVLIPCHRVIRSDGTLGGYAYGVAIKRELLAREGKS